MADTRALQMALQRIEADGVRGNHLSLVATLETLLKCSEGDDTKLLSFLLADITVLARSAADEIDRLRREARSPRRFF